MFWEAGDKPDPLLLQVDSAVEHTTYHLPPYQPGEQHHVAHPAGENAAPPPRRATAEPSTAPPAAPFSLMHEKCIRFNAQINMKSGTEEHIYHNTCIKI